MRCAAIVPISEYYYFSSMNSSSKAIHPDVSDITTVDARPVPETGRAARVAFWTLVFGFGGFLLWASLAPLDEGVPSPGAVSIDTKRKAVQHLSGGIVKEVLVREGEQVKEGQVLLRLDDATVRASYEAVRQRYLGLRVMEARLIAENTDRSSIEFHSDVLAAIADPLIKQQMQTQVQLFGSRRAAQRAELAAIEESVQGQHAQLQAFMTMLESRKTQLTLLREELGNTRGLVAEGYAPRNRQLELERMVAETSASVAELVGNQQRAERSIAELRQRAALKRHEYKKEVETQLSEVRREGLTDVDKLKAVTNDLGRMEIRSPTSGQVVGLAFQTPGGVIPPAQKIMDIVPADDVLLLEARVAPHMIDRVHAGQAVDVRFSAFAHSPQLVVAGNVTSVSHDVLVDPQSNASYFLARVAVTPAGLKTLGTRQLQPGMPAEIIFMTGERSMLTYMLHPLTKRMAAAMKEE
jgi:protease secretion system membrane fusion protein